MMNMPDAMKPQQKTFLSRWNVLSLRAKLVIILLMVALIPLSVAVFINDRGARQSALNDADEKLLSSAASVRMNGPLPT